jgi:hypothetical protein
VTSQTETASKQKSMLGGTYDEGLERIPVCYAFFAASRIRRVLQHRHNRGRAAVFDAAAN